MEKEHDDSTYHVIYYAGDRNKLSVLDLPRAMSYELADYAVASRQSFDSYEDAAEYAKQLAKTHGKEFLPDNHRRDDFLD